MASAEFQRKLGLFRDSQAQAATVVPVAEPVVTAPAAVASGELGVLPLDPRPDLLADSRQWTDLLKLAFACDGEQPEGVFGILHWLRCLGARIVVDPKFRYVLKPGEIGDEEWNGTGPSKSGYRELLKPYGTRIRTWLGEIR